MAAKDSRRAPPSLVTTLLPELFQTEQSAILHPTREAKRLGDCPPATAMRAVARHAREALPRFRALAEARGDAVTEAGTALGRLFSAVREFGVDLLLSSEKSYRGTLLGIHHGVGLVRLLGHAAGAEGDAELEATCHAWLTERAALVDAVERELAWFAKEPAVATSRARTPRGRRARSQRDRHAPSKQSEPAWQTPSTRSS